jgi:hypothetical protein
MPSDSIASALFAQVIDTVKSWLESMQVFVENGLVRVKKLVAETLTADELELRDKATGEVYCISIVNGEFEKVKGGCVTTVNSSQSITDNRGVGDQSSSEAISELNGPSQAPPPSPGLTAPHINEEAESSDADDAATEDSSEQASEATTKESQSDQSTDGTNAQDAGSDDSESGPQA